MINMFIWFYLSHANYHCFNWYSFKIKTFSTAGIIKQNTVSTGIKLFQFYIDQYYAYICENRKKKLCNHRKISFGDSYISWGHFLRPWTHSYWVCQIKHNSQNHNRYYLNSFLSETNMYYILEICTLWDRCAKFSFLSRIIIDA